MKENEFEKWLIDEYVTRNGTRLQKRPRSDAKSRCKRVEKHEGNLDSHYKMDGMRSLLNSLAYSKSDQDAGVSPKHSIPIEGDILNGTASLRNAVNLYCQFCMAIQI
ncbi:hypothetical protein JWG39_15715 [Desulforhopalus vacuolatus]|uniref:hypothetical protein n=1 Tax=Desulforhopalus vacuolatus TaxID=40414 RepID=UPI001962607E|nr:hypothetical protein [Desulforhopalus vacuolatus]MBM9521267.1 hypothetical protein [Desulforhopalus vacuolatus]